jgi:uncharacterized protein (TIGR00297 family)
MIPEAALALCFNAIFAALARWRGSLSGSGAVAAFGVGSFTWIGLGKGVYAALCVFFLTSTLLGKLGAGRKGAIEAAYSKGQRRDAGQVFANGGISALCGALALLSDLSSDPQTAQSVRVALVWAASAALASANADTWATELGVLSRGQPWHLTEFKRVPAGTSGAVSALGSIAALLGAAAIGVTSALLVGPSERRAELAVVVTLAGFAGALIDSLTGGVNLLANACAAWGAGMYAHWRL